MVGHGRVRRSCLKCSSPGCCQPRWDRGVDTTQVVMRIEICFILLPPLPFSASFPLPSASLPHLSSLTSLPLLLNFLSAPFPSPSPPSFPPPSPLPVLPPPWPNLLSSPSLYPSSFPVFFPISCLLSLFLPPTAYPPAICERPVPCDLCSSSGSAPPKGYQVPF